MFGRNRVSTYLLVGLGEDPDELVDGRAPARRARASTRSWCRSGRWPAPWRPTSTASARPTAVVLADVTRRVAAGLRAPGMRGADQGAGCAACGACSALPAAGG